MIKFIQDIERGRLNLKHREDQGNYDYSFLATREVRQIEVILIFLLIIFEVHFDFDAIVNFGIAFDQLCRIGELSGFTLL